MSSASNPAPQPTAPASEVERRELRALEQKAHEPSMEEILASIRRIIADDKALPLSRKANAGNLAEKSQHLASMQHLAATQEAINLESGGQLVERASQPLESKAPPVAAEPKLDHEAQTEAIFAHEPLHADTDEGDSIVDLAQMPDLRETFASGPPQSTDEAAGLGGINGIGTMRSNVSIGIAGAVANAKSSEPLASPLTDASVASSFDALSKSMMLNNSALIEDLTREMLRPMLKTWLDDNLPVMVERLVRTEIERVARGGRG